MGNSLEKTLFMPRQAIAMVQTCQRVIFIVFTYNSLKLFLVLLKALVAPVYEMYKLF